MVKKTYNIYIDHQINNSLLFNPVRADNKVLREKWLGSIYSTHLGDFNELFLHLAEQFNKQVGNIGLHDQVKLGLHQNNKDQCLIIYISTDVDNIDKLPIKELDAYLRILVENINDYITNSDGYTKYTATLVTANGESINTEWTDYYHNWVSNPNSIAAKYDGVVSASYSDETSECYTFGNGWTLAVHLSSLASTAYNDK